MHMLQPKTYQSAAGPVNGIEVDVRTLTAWNPLVTQVRETILNGFVVGSQGLAEVMDLSPEARACQTSQGDVEHIAEGCLRAIVGGRLIDFGEWTQETMVHGGKRGGSLYNRGVIHHPFSRPWVFMHTWDGATCVYFVNPLDTERGGGLDCEAVEMNAVQFEGNHKALMISDRLLLEPTPEDDRREQYYAYAIPSVWRYLPGMDAAVNGNGSPANAAAGNVLDPLMTALLILSTRGIVRETVTTPEKLAKARAKNGKPPIPPYDRVDSRPYVTAIMARKARGRVTPKGGTHASPVAHLRRGHMRELADGRETFVRDALVAMTDEAKAAWAGGRSHYAVKP